jgi:hypothetical protein
MTSSVDFSSLAGKSAFKQVLNGSPDNSFVVVALFAGVIGESRSLVDKISGALERQTDPAGLRHPTVDVNFVAVYNCASLASWYMNVRSEIAQHKANSGFKKSLMFVSSTTAYADGPLSTIMGHRKIGPFEAPCSWPLLTSRITLVVAVSGLFRNICHSTPARNIRCNCLAPHFLRIP